MSRFTRPVTTDVGSAGFSSAMVTPLTSAAAIPSWSRRYARDTRGPQQRLRPERRPVQRTLQSVMGLDAIPDLLQEVFIRAIDRIGELKNLDEVQELADDHRNLHRARPHPPSGAAAVALSVLARPDPRQHREPPSSDARRALTEVYEVLKQLSANDRIAFALRFIDGMTLPDGRGRRRRRRWRHSSDALVRAEKRFLAMARARPQLAAVDRGRDEMEPAKPDLIEVGDGVSARRSTQRTTRSEALRGGRETPARAVIAHARRGAVVSGARARVALCSRRWPSLSAVAAVRGLDAAANLVPGGHRPGRIGDVVEANNGSPLGVRFSEGSSIVAEAAPGCACCRRRRRGRGCCSRTGPLDVAIVHQRRHATRWRFEAGPMAVLVTGTRFRVDWNAERAAFALDIRRVRSWFRAPALQGADRRRGRALRVSCLPADGASRRPPSSRPARGRARPGGAPPRAARSAPGPASAGDDCRTGGRCSPAALRRGAARRRADRVRRVCATLGRQASCWRWPTPPGSSGRTAARSRC